MNPDAISNCTIDQNFAEIQAVLGEYEDFVILTESRGQDCVMDLWLLYNRRARILNYVVTNDAYGSSNRTRKFASLRPALSFYKEIRAAGSWRDYYEDHPAEEAGDKGNPL